jgi:hypothetical protein
MNPPETQPQTGARAVPSKKAAEEAVTLPGAKEAARIKVPDDDAFLQDYILDDKLQALAAALIESCEELNFIDELDFTLIYLWKRQGGKSSGQDVLGKCVKLSGLVKYFGKADFVIWLGGDTCRTRPDTNFAALMYHELCHVDKDDKDQPATQGHEFEGFAGEVMRFGIWRESMKPIATAFQHSLFPEEVVTQ